MAAGNECTDTPKARIFRYNAGQEMSIFPRKHPYLPKGCGDCTRNLNLAYDPKREQCRVCVIIGKLATECLHKQEYERLKNDPDYKEVEYDPISGGVKATHVDHNYDEQIGIFGIPRGEYERLAVDALFNKGYSVVLKSEKSPEGEKCPDGYLNGVLMDIKGIENGKPLYALNRANVQKVKTVVLYFHDHANYSMESISKDFEYLPTWIENNSRIKDKTINLETVVCVVRLSDGSFQIQEIKKPGT